MDEMKEKGKATRDFEEAMVDYAEALHRSGALEGPTGKMEFTEDVKRLLDGIHTVLAGGRIEKLELDDSCADKKVFKELTKASQHPVDIFNKEQRGEGGEVFYG